MSSRREVVESGYEEVLQIVTSICALVLFQRMCEVLEKGALV